MAQGLLVELPHRVPSNRNQLTHHRNCITHRTHPTRWVVAPRDRHLYDPVTAAAPEEQNFHVKRPAVDALPTEELVSDLSPECFEPALGVRDVRNSDHPHQPVENPP